MAVGNRINDLVSIALSARSVDIDGEYLRSCSKELLDEGPILDIDDLLLFLNEGLHTSIL